MRYFLLLILYSGSLLSIDYISQGSEIQNQLIEEVCHEYGLGVMGSGGGFKNEMNNLSVHFLCERPVSIVQARELFVKIKEKFAERVNSCRPLRPHLHRYPFSAAEDVKIRISFSDSTTYKKYPSSEVDTIGFGRGKVWFNKKNGNDPYLGKDILIELYETSRAIVLGEKDKMPTSPPEYLYKFISLKDWELSLLKKEVVPSTLDRESNFVHFATAEQLASVGEKFWAGREHLILKIETKKLHGHLLYETNPGGTNRYYHLYEGTIPLEAVVEVQKVAIKL